MARYRTRFPDLDAPLYLTDGGLETTLVFHEGLDLPCFASFVLVEDEEGRRALRRYYDAYLDVARERGAALLLDTPTWRANADWGAKLGCGADALARANRRAVELVEGVRERAPADQPPIEIGGSVGPRGDGYVAQRGTTADEARAYHAVQIETLAGTACDFVSALTFNDVEEALGVVGAARDAGLPVVLSFTVETDGRLDTGVPLGEAISIVDDRTGGYASYYMVNCAHPTHFAHALERGEPWTERVGGVRANASALSHAELDACEELDEGDPLDLARRVVALRDALPRMFVYGGCCGTDHRHVDALAVAASA